LAREPIYREYLYPNGLGWGAATHILLPDGCKVSIGFESAFSDGPLSKSVIEKLTLLRPHLARSLALTVQTETRTLASMTDSLASFGVPACVVDDRLRIKVANELFQGFIPFIVLDRKERIALSRPSSDALLLQLIQQGHARRSALTVGSIPLPPSNDEPAAVLHIVPICGSARELFSTGLFIVSILNLEPHEPPDAALLRGLFNLTPAEGRVARLISTGISAVQASRVLGLSVETVRSQLKSIFAKTGAANQASLVALLAGVRMPRASSKRTTDP
jgi:DNA-binding CsgD family transcriptional regulator